MRIFCDVILITTTKYPIGLLQCDYDFLVNYKGKCVSCIHKVSKEPTTIFLTRKTSITHWGILVLDHSFDGEKRNRKRKERERQKEKMKKKGRKRKEKGEKKEKVKRASQKINL